MIGIGLGLGMTRGGGSSSPYLGLNLTPDYWVDAVNGDDGNAGTSEGAAWASLDNIAAGILTASETTVVRVKAGTYDKVTDFVVVSAAPLNSNLIIVFEPECIIDGTLAAAAGPNNAFEFNGLNNYATTVYGNGLLVRNFQDGSNTLNGFGNRNNHILNIYNVIVDNLGDGLSGHGNATINAYDSTFRNCTKAAFAHVETCTTNHYRCSFEGRASAVIGIGTNLSSNRAYFENCEFVPATAAQILDRTRCDFVRCEIGTLTVRVAGTNANDSTYTNCYTNFSIDTNQTMTLTRCFGKASFRLRSGGGLTMRNCAFSAPASGSTSVFSDFGGSGIPTTLVVEDNIFETATAAAFMAIDATNAGLIVSGSRSFNNNCLSGSAAYDADLVTADSSNVVRAGSITADAQIGAANTLVMADYAYASGSPCIGAGKGGGDIGFDASEAVPVGVPA